MNQSSGSERNSYPSLEEVLADSQLELSAEQVEAVREFIQQAGSVEDARNLLAALDGIRRAA